jgi:hypothetical protein
MYRPDVPIEVCRPGGPVGRDHRFRQCRITFDGPARMTTIDHPERERDPVAA